MDQPTERDLPNGSAGRALLRSRCPSCGVDIGASARYVGTKLNCIGCGARFRFSPGQNGGNGALQQMATEPAVIDSIWVRASHITCVCCSSTIPVRPRWKRSAIRCSRCSTPYFVDNAGWVSVPRIEVELTYIESNIWTQLAPLSGRIPCGDC